LCSWCRWDLFQLLYYFKNYPTIRVMKVLFGKRALSAFFRSLGRKVTALAAVLQSVRDSAWDERHEPVPNVIKELYGEGCCGAVDTFPIIVNRPKNATWQAALYSGKYKHHVVKVQALVSLFVSGPHIGVRSDIRLWREYGPDLAAEDLCCLGDKAYVSSDTVLTPTPVPIGGELTPEQKEDNITLGWVMCLSIAAAHSFALQLVPRDCRALLRAFQEIRHSQRSLPRPAAPGGQPAL
jgi:hypothetical protein